MNRAVTLTALGGDCTEHRAAISHLLFGLPMMFNNNKLRLHLSNDELRRRTRSTSKPVLGKQHGSPERLCLDRIQKSARQAPAL